MASNYPQVHLGDILEFHCGYDLPKTSFTDGRIPVAGSSSIRVAEYLTVLPPREALEKWLHLAVETAQAKMGVIMSNKGSKL
jgi:hypothetical protein